MVPNLGTVKREYELDRREYIILEKFIISYVFVYHLELLKNNTNLEFPCLNSIYNGYQILCNSNYLEVPYKQISKEREENKSMDKKDREKRWLPLEKLCKFLIEN